MRLTPAAGPAAASSWLAHRSLAPFAVFVASCLLYLVNLERSPHPDELYHVLAARGLLEHGEPRIAEGLYTRVFAYTWLVGQMFALLGESLAAARLPSLLAMAALNALLFSWLRKEADARAAWIAAGLFMISPFAVENAQFARFYALQGLVFFAGCVVVYELVRQPWSICRRTSAGIVVALACLLFAVYLQPTTLLGMAGLGLWLGTAVAVPWLIDPSVARNRKLLAVGCCLLLGGVFLGVSLATGLADELWHRYRWVPVFNTPRADDFWFYHVFNLLFYPTLWPVIGLLGLGGLALWPRVTWFAMVVFATGFVLSSFAGPKNLRYVFYAQPFLFAVFGLGVAAFLPWLSRALGAFKVQLETHLAGVGLAGWRLPEITLWGSLLVVLVANAALLRTVTLLVGITVPPQSPPVQWTVARPLVEPLLREADVVVTMAELETLYFWERYDVLFSPSRLSEISDAAEFAADFRTGRPVISTRESLALLFDCRASGVFIAPASRWRLPQLIDADAADFIERETARLELPPATRLMVFTWRHALVRPNDPRCEALGELGRDRVE